SGQRQFRGLGGPDQTREKPSATVTGDNAQFDEALRHFGVFHSDTQVTHAGQVEAGSDGMAIDGSNGGDLQVVKGQRQALYAFPVFMAQVCTAELRSQLTLHFINAASGGEYGTACGDNDDSGRMFCLDAVNGLQKGVHQAAAGQRVASGRVVHRQGDNTVFILFEMKNVAHVVLVACKRKSIWWCDVSDKFLYSRLSRRI